VKEVEGLVLNGGRGHAEVSKGKLGPIIHKDVVFDHSVQDVTIDDWCGSCQLPSEQRSVHHEGWTSDQISNELHNLAIGIHIRTGELKCVTTEFVTILEKIRRKGISNGEERQEWGGGEGGMGQRQNVVPS
jgi:hypothetical protein